MYIREQFCHHYAFRKGKAKDWSKDYVQPYRTAPRTLEEVAQLTAWTKHLD
jgi:hypothetical protein